MLPAGDLRRKGPDRLLVIDHVGGELLRGDRRLAWWFLSKRWSETESTDGKQANSRKHRFSSRCGQHAKIRSSNLYFPGYCFAASITILRSRSVPARRFSSEMRSSL